MSSVFEGSCLCGALSFTVTGFSKKAANCHCSMCRKFHGAAFGTLVEVQGLQWRSGKEALKEFVSQNGTIRTFCSHCGSSVGFRGDGEPIERIELAISLFDTSIPVVIDAQIYTDYKANWCSLLIDVPVYPEGRDT